jgi:cardiolipin synthase
MPLLDAGGHLAVFLPPVPVRLNFRNHRKVVVIDGKVGYLGGLNIANEYLGLKKRFGYWRDTHMRITGGAVNPLTLRFIMDWNFASRDKLPVGGRFFDAPVMSGGDEKQVINNVRMQIVSCGPDTKHHNVLNGFIKMISSAKRSVYIQSPYFVPDEGIFSALRVAALSGIDVRIMFPANPDHFFVYWAALSYLGELIEIGVKCYEYTKGFIHSKTVMTDGEICTVGTANMDERSFKLNFECTAFIYDREVTAQLEAAFFKDMKDCNELTPEKYAARGRITKIKESFSRLLAPLL